jgi:hypothetical protein
MILARDVSKFLYGFGQQTNLESALFLTDLLEMRLSGASIYRRRMTMDLMPDNLVMSVFRRWKPFYVFLCDGSTSTSRPTLKLLVISLTHTVSVFQPTSPLPRYSHRDIGFETKGRKTKDARMLRLDRAPLDADH